APAAAAPGGWLGSCRVTPDDHGLSAAVEAADRPRPAGRHRGGGAIMRQEDDRHRSRGATPRGDSGRVEPPRDPETRTPETPEIEQPKEPARITQPPEEPQTEPPASPSVIPPAEPEVEPPERREGEEVTPERPPPPE